MNKTDIQSLRLEELKIFLTEMGEKGFRAEQIFHWIHKELSKSFHEMTNLSKQLRHKLEEQAYIVQLEEADKLVSRDGSTTKYLFRLADGQYIESVLMRYKHGNSVCISSQVGCKMGCSFCASTIDGFERNLTISEMLEQVYHIQKHTGERVSHVVVMGMGEPLDNMHALMGFIQNINHEKGQHMSQRNLTVSTCGLVDKIRQLAEEAYQITLAISLHAPDNQLRSQIMPIANRYSIDELLDAVQYYFDKTHRRVTMEYSLIAGVNDQTVHAERLAKRIRALHCHVNLIPVNPVEERHSKAPQKENVMKFKNILEKYQINVTIRRELGQDIHAACGQLRKRHHSLEIT